MSGKETKLDDLNHNLEEKITEATADLIEAKKLAKIGIWSCLSDCKRICTAAFLRFQSAIMKSQPDCCFLHHINVWLRYLDQSVSLDKLCVPLISK